jgi:ERCC4-type nuclease
VDRREDDAGRRTRRSDDLRRYIKPESLVQVLELEYADVALLGNGPDDRPVQVGVEIKSIADVLACIRDGRFTGHQLPGLLRDYDYIWLVVEGEWRACPASGILQCRKWNPRVHHHIWEDFSLGERRWMAREVEASFLTIAVKSGIRTHFVPSREETARWVATLWWWWNGKEFAEHRSHLATKTTGAGTMFCRASLAERIAGQLPGVGETRARAAAEQFRSVREMINASAAAWREVEGIGKGIAASIVEAVTKERA